MLAAVDLHIHTALSPCADDAMTPNNIVNMALLKGLDIIAITDHNSASNCEAVMKCASGTKLAVVPGIELETIEEVHMVCLFPEISKAVGFGEYIQSLMPALDNREDIFGRQLIMDENDNITGHEKRMLLTAAAITAEEAFFKVQKAGGVMIPAHIDRESHGLLSNFGMVPPFPGLKWLEVSGAAEPDALARRFPDVKNYNIITSSDAHYLGDILERQMYIEVEAPEACCVISALKR